MTKHYQQKLAAILTFTLLSCGAPLLLSANALALENRKPEVATTEIAPLIAKLKSYLAKVPDAKSTDYLPSEIATRYNLPIAVPPQSPQPVTV